MGMTDSEDIYTFVNKYWLIKTILIVLISVITIFGTFIFLMEKFVN